MHARARPRARGEVGARARTWPFRRPGRRDGVGAPSRRAAPPSTSRRARHAGALVAARVVHGQRGNFRPRVGASAARSQASRLTPRASPTAAAGSAAVPWTAAPPARRARRRRPRRPRPVDGGSPQEDSEVEAAGARASRRPQRRPYFAAVAPRPSFDNTREAARPGELAALADRRQRMLRTSPLDAFLTSRPIEARSRARALSRRAVSSARAPSGSRSGDPDAARRRGRRRARRPRSPSSASSRRLAALASRAIGAGPRRRADARARRRLSIAPARASRRARARQQAAPRAAIGGAHARDAPQRGVRAQLAAACARITAARRRRNRACRRAASARSTAAIAGSDSRPPAHPVGTSPLAGPSPRRGRLYGAAPHALPLPRAAAQRASGVRADRVPPSAAARRPRRAHGPAARAPVAGRARRRARESPAPEHLLRCRGRILGAGASAGREDLVQLGGARGVGVRHERRQRHTRPTAPPPPPPPPGGGRRRAARGAGRSARGRGCRRAWRPPPAAGRAAPSARRRPPAAPRGAHLRR